MSDEEAVMCSDSEESVEKYPLDDDSVMAIHTTESNQLILGLYTGHVMVYNFSNWEDAVFEKEIHIMKINSIASNAQYIAIGSEDETCAVLDATSFNLATMIKHDGAVDCVLISEENVLISCDLSEVKLVHVPTKTFFATIQRDNGIRSNEALAVKGQYFTIMDGKKLKYYRFANKFHMLEKEFAFDWDLMSILQRDDGKFWVGFKNQDSKDSKVILFDFERKVVLKELKIGPCSMVEQIKKCNNFLIICKLDFDLNRSLVVLEEDVPESYRKMGEFIEEDPNDPNGPNGIQPGKNGKCRATISQIETRDGKLYYYELLKDLKIWSAAEIGQLPQEEKN